MSKKSIAVRIAGHDYKIRSDSDGKVLRQIATYVDQTMDRVRKETGTVDSLDVAILACLNLGRENLALKNQQPIEASDASLRSLIDRVESAIPELIEQHATGPQTDGGSQDDQAETPTAAKQKRKAKSKASQAPETALELPSIENLHERGATESTVSSTSPDDEEVLPEARVAAGGRDRAS